MRKQVSKDNRHDYIVAIWRAISLTTYLFSFRRASKYFDMMGKRAIHCGGSGNGL